MPSKIFISYRREDTAANALGIGQYLEHQFGRKNVFIDVDMRAGAKFPDVLQQRLAECKVLLALIGPGWLNARDDQGRRRLDNSDDWVRLEVAHALRRCITVIPVRVKGAALPTREELPEEMRGLLDHQAVAVTTIGFRNEMAGLARDIRAIPNPNLRRRFAAIAAITLVLVATFALILNFGLLKRLRISNQQPLPDTTQNAIWRSLPGEWVLFAVDKQPLAYYFKPTSVEISGGNVAFNERVPIKTISATSAPSEQTAAYEDNEFVISCKDGLWAEAEITYYDKAGDIVSHFKRGDPASLNLRKTGQKINPGSILAVAQHLLCDKNLRVPLVTKQELVDNNFSYLSPTPSGDGDFYSLKNLANNPHNHFESLLITKWYGDQPYAALFPGQTVLGLPSNYRTQVERLQVDCTERKFQLLEINRFDSNNDIVDEYAPIASEPVNVTKGSSMDLWLDRGCSASVPNRGGTYEGTNRATYNSGGEAEQKITIHVTQSGDDVTISFQTPIGGQAKGEGKLSGGTVKSLTLRSTAPGCPGSYKGSLKFTDDTMSWSYEGSDCGGAMKGQGTAKKTET